MKVNLYFKNIREIRKWKILEIVFKVDLKVIVKLLRK